MLLEVARHDTQFARFCFVRVGQRKVRAHLVQHAVELLILQRTVKVDAFDFHVDAVLFAPFAARARKR